VANLMVMIFHVILYEIQDACFSHTFLNITSICRMNLALLFRSIDSSVWLTVAFTFERFVSICFENVRTKYCTEKTAYVVITVVCCVRFSENLPIDFIYEPREVIDNVFIVL